METSDFQLLNTLHFDATSMAWVRTSGDVSVVWREGMKFNTMSSSSQQKWIGHYPSA